jgi:hypothetical protein
VAARHCASMWGGSRVNCEEMLDTGLLACQGRLRPWEEWQVLRWVARLGMQGHPSWCSTAGSCIACWRVAAHAPAPQPARPKGNCPWHTGFCVVLWMPRLLPGLVDNCVAALLLCGVGPVLQAAAACKHQTRAPCCPASCRCWVRTTSPSVVPHCWGHAHAAMSAAALRCSFCAQSFFVGAAADPGEWLLLSGTPRGS